MIQDLMMWGKVSAADKQIFQGLCNVKFQPGTEVKCHAVDGIKGGGRGV